MRAVLCDRCGGRITREKAGYINLDMRDVRTGDLDGNNTYDEWDLCPKCMSELERFLHPASESVVTKMRQVAPEAAEAVMSEGVDVVSREEEEEEAEDPEDKDVAEIIKTGAKKTMRKTKGSRHPQADLIIKMIKDGSSIQEIMSATGCSNPTVRKYMKEVGDKQVEKV